MQNIFASVKLTLCGVVPFKKKYIKNRGEIEIAFIKKEEQIKFGEYVLLFGSEYLSSPLLSENIKIQIHKTIILPTLM